MMGRKAVQATKEKEVTIREREEERIPPPKVQDDDDGHLIYRKGDYLDSRCRFYLSNYLYHPLLVVVL